MMMRTSIPAPPGENPVVGPAPRSARLPRCAALLSIGLAGALGCAPLETERENPFSTTNRPTQTSREPEARAIAKAKARPTTGDVSRRRTERKAKLLDEYERKRTGAQYQAAAMRLQQGDIDGAAETLASILARHPHDRDARLLQADIHLLQDQAEQAEQVIRQVLAENPDDAAAVHALGLVLLTLDRVDQGATYLEKAAELAPENPVYRAALREARGHDTRSSADMPPTMAVASDAGAAAPANLQEEPAAAVSADAERLVRQGAAALRAGRVEQAESLFRRAQARQPRSERLALSIAVEACRNRRFPLAARLVSDAVQQQADSAALYRMLGYCRLQLGETAAARDALQHALSLDNGDALAYFLLGQTLNKLGQFDAAGRHIATARRLDPTLPVPH